MDTQFVRDRITQLRLKKGVSEYQMSYDLGHSRSYVYNISSGKSLPPMAEFLQICNYFDITPSQFFDESEENPALLQTAIEELRKLNDDDLMVNQSTEKKNTRQIQMTIEGHKVTISFAQEANPTLSALVRNTLLDAYIRKNGLCSEEQPA